MYGYHIMKNGVFNPYEQLSSNAKRFGLSLTDAQITLGSENAKAQLSVAALQDFPRSEPNTAPAPEAPLKLAYLSSELGNELKSASREELEAVQDKYGCFVDFFIEQATAPGSMPIAIKDVFVFAQHQPTAGLAAAPNGISVGKTRIVERLEAAGGTIVGTTKCSPWCYVPTEQNEFVNPPINPLGDDLLVGGSSSGAAVAVAAGVVSAAIGSDTGGSVRIPAALCGIYGYKSTPAGIGKSGCVPLGGLQDTVGILANTPDDLIKVHDVIALKQPEIQTEHTIGIPEQIFDLCDPEICTARDVISDQAKVSGGGVVSCPGLDMDRINAVAGIITGHFAGLFHGARMADHPDEYPTSIIGRLCTGLAFTEDDKLRAISARDHFLDFTLTKVFGACSFLVAPTVNRYAQKAPLPWQDQDPAYTGALNIELLSMNRWVNLLGLPAVSIPVDIGKKVPAAVQIVGKPGTDTALLELVRTLVK